MADLDDIRRGIAALLRDVLPADAGQVSPWLLETFKPPSLQVVGLDVDGYTHTDFGGGVRMLVLVEGWAGTVSSIGAQQLLNRWIPAVADAVESDNTTSGALFSRLGEDGTVTAGQAAAADSVGYAGYRGQTIVAKNQAEYLVATWAVEVYA